MTKKSQPTQNKSIKSNSKAGVLSMSGKRKEKVNLSKTKTLNYNNNIISRKGHKPSGLTDINFGQIIDTAKDVVSTGARLVAGDPTSLLNVPNTILKVVDTAQSTVKALSKDNAPKVVVDNVDVKQLQNAKVIEHLKQSVPVINTTNVPSVYSSEITLPPLKTSERYVNGFKVLNVTGSSMVSTAITFHSVSSLTFFKAYSSLINPVDAIFFGPRVQQYGLIHQKWRLNTIVANYIPSVGTQIAGQVHLSFMNGTSPTDLAATKTDIAQRESYKPSSVFNQNQLATRGTESFLWCSRAVASSEQIKFFANQQFEVWTDGNNQTVYAQPIGNIMFTFDIDFMHPVEYSYSFMSMPERRLQGHWISNYMTLDYGNHLKFLRLLTNKLITQIIADTKAIELGNVSTTKLFEKPYTVFKVSALRQRLRSFFSDLLDKTKVFKQVISTEDNNQYCYLAEVIKLVDKRYFSWIFEFLIDGYIEIGIMKYSASEEGDTLIDFILYLLRDFLKMTSYLSDKMIQEEIDFEDEFSAFELTNIFSDPEDEENTSN
jgi:hypothetical protein